MPRERAFWMVLGSLVLVGIVMGLLGRRAADRPLALVKGSPSPVAQESRTRTWRDARFALLYRIAAGEGEDLRQPTLLRADSSGNLYVLDSAVPSVMKISAEGQVLARYAHASMGNPTDFAIGPRGEVWVCDPDRRVLAIFASDGTFLRTITPQPSAARLALGSGGFVATGITGGPGLFRKYSMTGALQSSFGDLFAAPLQSSLAADGWIVSDGEFLVYPFRNTGLLVSYTMDGKLRFFRETINRVPLPMVRVDAAGRASVDRNAPVASINGCMVGDELYILTESAPGRALDVYDAEQGNYAYSLRLPEADLRYFVLVADRLYGASRRGVKAWRMARSSEATSEVSARRTQ